MKVLFVFPNRVDWFGEAPLGVLYLSSILEEHGHKTDLFDTTPYPSYEKRIVNVAQWKANPPAFIRDLHRKIRSFKPDLLALSVLSNIFSMGLALAKIIKEDYDIPTIFGGAHPTVDPEGTISNKNVDMICVGEGEMPLLELVSKMEKGDDYSQVQNIWVKKNGQIIRNPVRPLLQDLDSLPYPNRDLLDKRYIYSETSGTNFITGRGCPYLCTYCINAHLQELYRGKGKFVRLRKVWNVIDEIRQVKERCNIKKVTFSDDTFSLNKKRVIELLRMYRQEIGLPFLCQTRVDLVDRELLEELKKAGCVSIDMGIESGNDYLRREVLNRRMSKYQIVMAFRFAKDMGIKTASFNMIGVPFETSKTIRETIEVNRSAKPDTVLCTIFMPFEGTKLGQMCKKNNWIKSSPTELPEYYYDSVVRLPTISRHELISYQRFFNIYVQTQGRYDWLIDLFRLAYAYVPSGRVRSILSLGLTNYMITSERPKQAHMFLKFVVRIICRYATGK